MKSKTKSKILLSAGAMLVMLALMTGGTAWAQGAGNATSRAKFGLYINFKNGQLPPDNVIDSLAAKLGFDPGQLKSELQSGKTLKAILQEHNIKPGQLGLAFGRSGTFKPTDAMIGAVASAFGLDAVQIKTELQSGKTFKQVLQEHNITAAQLAAVLGNNKFGRGMNSPFFSAKAAALNLSTDQLRQDLQNGQTLDQIAQAQGMTLTQFRQAWANQLQQMILSGKLKVSTQLTSFIQKLQNS